MSNRGDTVQSVVYLRAVAAIAVCAIHFKLNTGISLNKYIDFVINNGHQGVTVFFVISGFILPLSLYRKEYSISGFFNFILKRSLRVDPPFWFSILLLFTIAYYPLSLLSFRSIMCHITYIVPFFPGQRWFTDVYWTLSIEFQFYLLLALLFPLLMQLPKHVTVIVLIIVSYLCLRFTVRWFIISYVYQFTFGFIAFLGFTQTIKKNQLWITLISFTLLICYNKSIVSGLIPFFTVLAILFIKSQKVEPIGSFLGKISYSIYLIHIPLMAFVRHLLSNISLLPTQLCGIYIIAIIPLAYLMYLTIEKPCIDLSKKINVNLSRNDISKTSTNMTSKV